MINIAHRALALACLLLASGAVVRAQTPAADAAARVLVLPFDNTGGEARLHWLGEASAVLVTDGLKARGVSAISRDERVRAFEELHLPLSATLSRATVIKVAELLGARELVLGTFHVQDRELTIQAQTIRVDAGRARPAATERGQLTELFELHDRLVRDLTPESTASAHDRCAAAAGRLRELRQGPARDKSGSTGDVPRNRAPGCAELRTGAALALGGPHRSGRSRRRPGGDPANPFDLATVRAGSFLRRDLHAQSPAL